MIAVWPTDLPRPLRDGYGAQRLDPRRRRESDNGPPMFRRRYTAVAREISLTLVVDLEQKAIFDRFWIDTLAEGSLTFWMSDPVEDGAAMLDEAGAVLLDEDGLPLLAPKRMLCLMAEPAVEGPVKGITRTLGFTVVDLP